VKASKLILRIALILIVGVAMAGIWAFSPLLCVLVIIALTVLSHNPKANTAYAGISVEVWVNYIMENLFKDNGFLDRCFKEDQYVIGGSVVHIPQAGAKPNVVKNRSTYPVTVTARADNDIVYALDNYSTDATHIPKAELMEISYDKIDSVLREHVSSIMDLIGDAMLYKWAASASANIIRTTGADVAAHLTSATGNRKVHMKEELKKAQKLMNMANISKQGRIAVYDSEMLSQLQDDADLKKRDVGMELDMKNGTIMRLYGFDIIERSTVNAFTNAGTPVAKDYDAVGAATDNAGILCYQQDCVTRALGTVDFFEDLRSAIYQGDLYSILVKMGGRKRRANGEGVISIVQAAS